jgi:hypothetical protein
MKRNTTRNVKTIFARHGLGRLASNPLFALILVFLSLPCLLPAQTLVHRYSFVSDASDSVGGPAWNGTLQPGSGGNPATISNGLILPGNPGGGNGVSGYVSLPNGIVSGDTSVTVECWVEPTSVNTWAEIWDFGSNPNPGVNFALIQDSALNNGPGGNMRVAFTPDAGEVDIDAPSYLPADGTTNYVVVTYDNTTLIGDLYTNAVLDGSTVFPSSTYSPGGMGGVGGTTENTFGNDVYGDPQFGGTIYEVRIWNGVVSERYINASLILGPSVLVTNLTPTSASITAGPGVVVTGTEQAIVTVHLAPTGTTNLVATSDATNWISSNTNILTVNSHGLITGVGAGTATVSATVDGVSTGSSSLITVTPQTLQNRYSFVSDATDSVSGANGTLVGPNGGAAATITNGLILPGNTNGTFGYSGYVSLPSGLLLGTTSLTVECWVTQNQGNGWAEIWDFGNNGSQNFALIPDPDDNDSHLEVAFNPDNNNIELDTPTAFPNNAEQYVVVTYNNSTLLGSLYTNGVLDASQAYPSTNYCPGGIGGAGGTTENMLGNDVYGDWQFDGTIYEFRIWNGAVSPLYIAASAAAGSSVVITNTTLLSDSITVLTNIVGAQTQQAVVTGDFDQVSGATLTSLATNWTSSNTNILTVSSSGLITGLSGGNATVSATVAGLTATSASITVALTAPIITQEPVPATAVVGESGTLTVDALGGDLTYQWSEGGVLIAGATGSALTLSDLTFGQAGNYTVVVSNALGTATSVVAQLTIDTAILAHRYSFVSDASDSVGGSNWNGTLIPAGNAGGSDATISGGLSLPGGGGGGYSGYLALPGGILVGDTSLTIECWVTQNAPNGWGTVWDFALNGNSNFEMCPYPDNNNNNLMSAFTPHQDEQDVQSTVSFPTGTEQYVAVTYDNSTLAGNLYFNGAQVGTRIFPDDTYAPSTIGGADGTAQNWLGNDTYGDPQFQGVVYELRIWNGAIPQRQIAASALLGPTVLVTNLTPTSASVAAGSSVVVTGTEQATVNVTIEQTGTTNLVATVDATNWISSDPSVLSVNSSGLVTGVGVGTATVSATVAGIPTGSTGPITVSPIALQNRYSFVSDATDSINGADGTLVGPNGGNSASISNGLVLPGNTHGGYGYSGYVSLPGGLLLGTTSITVECWLTQNQGIVWAEAWDFGNNGNENFALITDPEDNNGNLEVALNPDNDNIELDTPTPFPNNAEQYVVVTYNNSTQLGSIYTNGVLDATQAYPYAVFSPGDFVYSPGSIGGSGGTIENALGNDVYGDPQFHGTIYEFRVWNGAVSPLYIALSAAAGPSVVVTNVTPLSLSLTVATNMVEAQTQQAVVGGDFAVASGVTVTGGATNWTSSSTNVLQVSSSGVITAVGIGSATISAEVSGTTVTSDAITVTPLSLGIATSGTNVVLTWSSGILLQAPTLLGPWTTNTAAVSPFKPTTTNGNQFFKILIYP